MTKKENDKTNTQTRVDLGDDLLERTAVPIGGSPSSTSHDESIPAAPAPAHDFESARILLNEGMTEEAKKILRQLLIADPSYVAAQELLAQIHEQELKEIFSGTDTARRFPSRILPDEPDGPGTDTEEILEKLEKDCSLGIAPMEPGFELRASLFRSPEMIEALGKTLEKELAELPMQDRVDLGIGFLEMSLYTLAQQQFDLARQASTTPEDLISTSSLLAYAYILARRPFDAISSLQSVLTDPDIPSDGKIEVFYLMGRAYEQIRKIDVAVSWYRQVSNIDPFYRDTQERLRRL